MSRKAAAAAPVSILGLEQQYEELNREYLHLSERERQTDSICSDDSDDEPPVEAAGRCFVFRAADVKFAEELPPLPDDVPVKTDSDTNKYSMLVWKMLEA